MTKNMLNVYVDTNIISALVRKYLSDEVMKYLHTILEFRKKGDIELYLSEVNSEEIEKIPEKNEDHLYFHKLIYKLIDNISLRPKKYSNLSQTLATKGNTGGSSAIATRGLFPAQQKDPLFIEIEKIIPEKNKPKEQEARLKDIDHLYQYKKNNLDVFWSEDKKTILKFAPNLKEIGITVMGSKDLIELLTK